MNGAIFGVDGLQVLYLEGPGLGRVDPGASFTLQRGLLAKVGLRFATGRGEEGSEGFSDAGLRGLMER